MTIFAIYTNKRRDFISDLSEKKDRKPNFITEWFLNLKEIHRNLISTFFIAIFILLVGIILVFAFTSEISGDIATAMAKVPSMLSLCILPVLLGLGLSILCGFISSKVKGNWIDKLIILLCALAISAPVFYIGMVLLLSWCHIMGLCSPVGNFEIPHLILLLVVPGLMIWQTQGYIINRTRKKSIVSNTFITVINFGFILMVYTLLDRTFLLNGFGTHLIYSLNLFNFAGSLFTIIIILFVVTTFSNLLFTGSRYLQQRYIKPKTILTEPDSEKGARDGGKVKTYILDRLKSPYFYIGAVFASIVIAFAVNPNLLTQYSLQQVLTLSPGSWDPPSPGHPLGTWHLGRDTLGLIAWGVQDLIVFCLFTVLIGLAGGLLLGGGVKFITVKFKRWGNNVATGFMILFYIVPIFVLVMVWVSIFDSFTGRLLRNVALVAIGVTLIPSFAKGFLNGDSMGRNLESGIKSLISHIPLNFAISAMIYTAVGFLGFISEPYQLGNMINTGRYHLVDAPWGTIWAGVWIFMIVFSFLILYLGLHDYKPKFRK